MKPSGKAICSWRCVVVAQRDLEVKKGTLGMQVEAIKLASVRRLASARLAELLTARFHRHEQELLYQGMFSSACSTLGVDQTFFR